MRIFKYIKDFVLVKRSNTSSIDIIEPQQSLIRMIEPQIETVFESDVVVSICEDNFLDTNDALAIAKYKNNLKLLIEEAKKKGEISNFKLIRDDDYFPYDWQWRVASKNTGIEPTKSLLSYMIRQSIACSNLGVIKNAQFRIPPSTSELNEELSKVDMNVGMIMGPVRFRSTKHFTINTPLSYTGEYNAVESNRNFTIIDDISNFLESGYAYTADYRDAYLDVTHEGLSISDSAVVLIEERKYSSIMSDARLANQLKDRRVVIYRGEEAVAINMILTELRVLPARPGNIYMTYDDEIRTILEQSMKKLCSINNIQYAKGHGNLFGKGGHFSDLYDGYNHDYDKIQEEFCTFLVEKFPHAAHLINYRIFRDSANAEDFIEYVGVDPLLSAIQEYNKSFLESYNKRYQEYIEDRESITPEISNIFKRTIQFIDKFYKDDMERTLTVPDIYKFRELVCIFLHSDSVEKQLLAANQICEMFNIVIDVNNSSFSI